MWRLEAASPEPANLASCGRFDHLLLIHKKAQNTVQSRYGLPTDKKTQGRPTTSYGAIRIPVTVTWQPFETNST